MHTSAHATRRNRLTVPAFLLAVIVALVLGIEGMATRHRAHIATPKDDADAAMLPRDRVAQVAAATAVVPAIATMMPAIEPSLHDAQTLLGPITPGQQQWLLAHGYQISQIDTDLPAHEREHLRAAALSGDAQAVDHYAALAALRGQSDAVHWLKQSAANGSTQALLRLAMWHNPPSGVVDKPEAIAWLLVAQRRGDPFAVHLLEQLSAQDDAQGAASVARAEALYQQLEHERYRRGLAAFANTTFPAE